MSKREFLVFEFGELVVAIVEANWDKWVSQRVVPLEQYKDDLTAYYAKNKIPSYRRVAGILLNKCMEKYAKQNNVEFHKSATFQVGGIARKCKFFNQKQ